MAPVMTVRNPADAMRATSRKERASERAATRFLSALRIYHVINEPYGPRAGQTAMRAPRLRSSRCMTDKVM
jgi:hypothetical protein